MPAHPGKDSDSRGFDRTSSWTRGPAMSRSLAGRAQQEVPEETSVLTIGSRATFCVNRGGMRKFRTFLNGLTCLAWVLTDPRSRTAGFRGPLGCRSSSRSVGIVGGWVRSWIGPSRCLDSRAALSRSREGMGKHPTFGHRDTDRCCV